MVGNRMNSTSASERFRLVCLLGGFCCLTLASIRNAGGQEIEPPSAMQRFATRINPMNWTMPNFRSIMPSQDEKDRVDEKKDSLLDEISATASRSWTKTKEVFDPSRYNPKKIFPASSRTPSSRSPYGRPKDEDRGFWSSLFAPDPPSKPITDVNDFLRQSKPRL